jgi:hypothetical protein
MIKAIKLYLHKPINCEWDELGKALHDLRFHFPKIMNHGINQYWFWQVEKERLKEKNGEYPTLKELPRPTKVIYDYIRGRCLIGEKSLKGLYSVQRLL